METCCFLFSFLLFAALREDKQLETIGCVHDIKGKEKKNGVVCELADKDYTYLISRIKPPPPPAPAHLFLQTFRPSTHAQGKI